MKFYVAFGGTHKPHEYIHYAQEAEALGFDRVYVYDDLLHHPAWPILTLMAEHTSTIELGPCLVNGFYRHPAILAANLAFLDDLSGGRAILGTGRGAFFDFLNLDDSEETTREGCRETIALIKHYLSLNQEKFLGSYFSSNEKVSMRFPINRDNIPIVLGTWNERMVSLAASVADELQVAETWSIPYLEKLNEVYCRRLSEERPGAEPKLSLGGMVCVSESVDMLKKMTRRTVATYLPYLKTILDNAETDMTPERFEQISFHSKRGDFEQAASLISDRVLDSVSLNGTPEMVRSKIHQFKDAFNPNAFYFGPPYGTRDTVIENLRFLANEVIHKL